MSSPDEVLLILTGPDEPIFPDGKRKNSIVTNHTSMSETSVVTNQTSLSDGESNSMVNSEHHGADTDSSESI